MEEEGAAAKAGAISSECSRERDGDCRVNDGGREGGAVDVARWREL
jgi:hypothetical protein